MENTEGILVAYLSLGGGEQGENKRDNIQLLSRQVIYVYIVLYTIYIHTHTHICNMISSPGSGLGCMSLKGTSTATSLKHTITSYTLTHSDIWEILHQSKLTWIQWRCKRAEIKPLAKPFLNVWTDTEPKLVFTHPAALHFNTTL